MDTNNLQNYQNQNKGAQSLVADHYNSNSDPYYLDEIKRPLFLSLIIGLFKWIFDSIQVIVIALAIFIIFYLFIVSPHTIDGVSMQPNFCNSDLILADKLTPKFYGYSRGDVIVFKHDEANDYIKRIIGMGGDRIMISNNQVYRNGELLNEPYLPKGLETELYPGSLLTDGQEYIVPDGKLFVLGDNRPNSTDSRRFLAIDPNGENTVKGKVRLILWPSERARIFKDTQGLQANECNIR